MLFNQRLCLSKRVTGERLDLITVRNNEHFRRLEHAHMCIILYLSSFKYQMIQSDFRYYSVIWLYCGNILMEVRLSPSQSVSGKFS